MDTVPFPDHCDYPAATPPNVLSTSPALKPKADGDGTASMLEATEYLVVQSHLLELTRHLELASAAMACSDAELQVLEDELNQALCRLARTQEFLCVRMGLDRILAQAQAGDDDQRACEVMQLLVPRFGDWCAFDRVLCDGTLRRRVLHSSPRLKLQSTRLEASAAEHDPLWKAIRATRDGMPRFYPEVSIAELSPGVARDRQHLLVELGLRSLLIVPLEARGVRLGTLTLGVGWGRPEFTRELLDFMQGVAAAVALALLVPEAQRDAATVLPPNAGSILPES